MNLNLNLEMWASNWLQPVHLIDNPQKTLDVLVLGINFELAIFTMRGWKIASCNAMWVNWAICWLWSKCWCIWINVLPMISNVIPDKLNPPGFNMKVDGWPAYPWDKPSPHALNTQFKVCVSCNVDCNWKIAIPEFDLQTFPLLKRISIDENALVSNLNASEIL